LAHENDQDFDLQIHFFQNLFPNHIPRENHQAFIKQFRTNNPEDNHLLVIRSFATNILSDKGLVIGGICSQYS
jgi:hypothetical protein